MREQNTKPNLADVLDAITRRPVNNRPRRRAQIAGLHKMSLWTGRPLADIPADIPHLRTLFAQVKKSGTTLKPHSFANVKFAVLNAVGHSGLIDASVGQGRLLHAFSPACAAFYMRLQDKHLRICLTRLCHYLSEQGLSPTNVDDDVFARYVAHLYDVSLQENLPLLVRRTALAWNKAILLQPDANLKPVTPPPSRRVRTLLRLEDLPPSFQAEVARFVNWAGHADIFAQNVRKKKLSPNTIGKLLQDFRRAATLLVRSGFQSDEIVSFKVMLTLDNFTKILREAHKEKNGAESAYNFQLALSLMVVGRDLFRLDPDTVAALTTLTYRVPRPKPQMNVKNQRLIERFDDSDALLRLIEAPRELWQLVRSAENSNRWTLTKAQAALAIALLPIIPIRLENLTSLTFDEHIFLRPHGVSTLRIPAEENKSGTALNFDIPPDLAAMMIEYRDDIAPEIIGCRPRYLFCRHDGGLKNFATVRSLIETYIQRYLGFHMNPQVFRHLAAKITLDQDPGAHVQVQQFLGHKKLSTTANYYSGWETARAQKGHIKNLEKTLAAKAENRKTKKRKLDHGKAN